MKRLYITLFTCLISALIVAGCGGGGSNVTSDTSDTSTSIAISGTLSGTGFVSYNWFDRLYSKFVTPAYAAGDRPNKVIAVSKDGTILDNFDINEDGTFEIDVSDLEEEQFALFVQDTVTSEVSGHIRLRNRGNTELLDVLDGSTFQNSLQLGTLDVTDLTGPELEETDAFDTEDQEFFKELANNDDAIASHQNKLTNTGISSYLSIVFDLGTISGVTNNFFDISTFSKAANFVGMRPLFYYYGDGAETLSAVSLFPPASLEYSDPNTGGGWTATDSATGIAKDGLSYLDEMSIVTIEMAYVDSVPDGKWSLINSDTDEVLGLFIFADTKPFNSSSVFKAFVPIPKINTDDDNNVTSVTLKLGRYDNSGPKSANKHFFDTVSEELLISYQLDGAGSTQNMHILESDEESLELTLEPSAEFNIADLDRMIISYEIGEAKYQFFLSVPST